MRHAFAQVFDPEEAEPLLNTVGDRLLVEAEVRRAECDVLLHGGGEYLVVGVLEDDPDELTHLAEVLLRDRFAPDQHLAGRGFENAVEVLEQGAFSCSVRPDNGDA